MKEWTEVLADREGLSEEEIRASWQSDLDAYKAMRKKYLLYEE